MEAFCGGRSPTACYKRETNRQEEIEACGRLFQVSTVSEVTRCTANVATDDESVDSLVIVDDVQTTVPLPGMLPSTAVCSS